ncbi:MULTISPECIES: hypothetical protein [Sphingobium]|jgi:hypothetical protein|uniref:Uncharacterized protein n=1 Tax=Sphingobium tyrosinilyticum TaxID=2715436 RepID=A0ABV9EZS5_9SPHN|nr:hypothetical protein [Sphingobium sp. EP60837]ANI78049.1 hypothetical protein EP837_01635 [Sphingobium sp. EP60837]
MSSRPKWIYALAAIAALLVLLLAWNWTALRARAAVGAGFGARVTCSCRYVEGRSIDSCRRDKEPGMALVTLSDDPESRAVEAAVPLLASRTARYRKGWGCLLDPMD